MSDSRGIITAINVDNDASLIMAACVTCRLAVACASPEDAVNEAIEHAEGSGCNSVRIIEILADAETEGKKIVQDAINDARAAGKDS
jgi:hydroxypyruvate isomerase